MFFKRIDEGRRVKKRISIFDLIIWSNKLFLRTLLSQYCTTSRKQSRCARKFHGCFFKSVRYPPNLGRGRKQSLWSTRVELSYKYQFDKCTGRRVMDGEYWNGIAMPIVGVAPWLRLNAIPIRTIHKHFRVSGMDSFKRPTFLRSFPLSLSLSRSNWVGRNFYLSRCFKYLFWLNSRKNSIPSNVSSQHITQSSER